MRAGELRRAQGLLRLVPRPAPRHAQDQGRLVHGRRHRRDPVPVVPPPVDALARVQKVQLHHLPPVTTFYKVNYETTNKTGGILECVRLWEFNLTRLCKQWHVKENMERKKAIHNSCFAPFI